MPAICDTITTTKTIKLVRKDNLTGCIRSFADECIKTNGSPPSIEQVIQHVGGEEVWKSYTPAHRSNLKSAVITLRWKWDHLTTLVKKYGDLIKQMNVGIKVIFHDLQANSVIVWIEVTGYVAPKDGSGTDILRTRYCKDESELLRSFELFMPGAIRKNQNRIQLAKYQVNDARKQLRVAERTGKLLAAKLTELECVNNLSKGRV
jgi:hypothetical protein